MKCKFKTCIFYLLLVSLILTVIQWLIVLRSTNKVEDEGVVARGDTSRQLQILKERVRTLDREINFLKYDEVGLRRAVVSSSCETIHIVSITSGAASTRDFVTMLKSLLLHRSGSPIHLHLITTKEERVIFVQLFDSWLIGGFAYNIYDADSFFPKVSWVPNKHYSGNFGLLKLAIVDILPDSVDDVIVLDTDLLFLDDIARLHLLFRSHLPPSALFAMVENQSEFYFRNDSWPAIDRGFNSGLILMRLKKLRDFGWMSRWRRVTEAFMRKLNEASHDGVVKPFVTLADQDIFNLVFTKYSAIIHKLRCEWNVQLGETSSMDMCLNLVKNLFVIHWNRPDKLAIIKDEALGPFHLLYSSYYQLNGALFRVFLTTCDLPPAEHAQRSLNITVNDDCFEFRRAAAIVYRTHLNYHKPKDFFVASTDLTVVTHLSIDRLRQFESLCSSWPGPISAAIHLKDADQIRFLYFLSESECVVSRNNILIHVVYEDGLLYPINYLRNVALNNSVTDFVFLLDIDFLISSIDLVKIMQSVSEKRKEKKSVFIVPAFETQDVDGEMPVGKAALREAFTRGTVRMFRSKEWPQGHRTTDFDRWFKSSEPYRVDWSKDFEPYLIASTKDLPPFDSRFVGFAWNKVSHILHLDALRFNFIVLPDIFVIHRPHAISGDLMRFRSKPLYRQCLQKLKLEFISDLSKRYGVAALKYLVADPPAAQQPGKT